MCSANLVILKKIKWWIQERIVTGLPIYRSVGKLGWISSSWGLVVELAHHGFGFYILTLFSFVISLICLKMKQTKVETGDVCGKITQSIPPPPPPPPPLPRFWVRKKVTESVTKQEIAKFWRKKLTEEEDHFLAAIKAAARIRARNLSVRSYNWHLKHFIRKFLGI